MLQRMKVTPHRMVSSPLGRSLATAAILAPFVGYPTDRIATDARLDEVALGAWEGLSDAEIRRGWPAETAEATERDWYFRAPGGERIPQIRRRLTEWLTETEIADGDLIAVGHGISSRLLRGIYSDLPDEQALKLDIDRDAVYILENRRLLKLRAD